MRNGWWFFAVCGAAAAAGLGFAWLNRADGNSVLVGLGAALFFGGFTALFGAAKAAGPPAPLVVGGLCLMVSAIGALISWWGRDAWGTSARGSALGPMLLVMAVLLGSLGVWLVVRSARTTPSLDLSASPGSGPSAIEVAQVKQAAALDGDGNLDAGKGPAWVWFPGDVLTDEPESVCWDWYDASESWPAGRESAHVAAADATQDELRSKAAELVGRDQQAIQMVLARQTIVPQGGTPTAVMAYLIR